jgi:ATP-binding cassette subfamily F protein uup
VNYLSVENITKSYGARTLFKDISFGIQEGQKVAIVAKNGSGKTSILRILSGDDQPDSGNVVFRKGLKVAYLTQDPLLDPELTILQSTLALDHPATAAVENYERALENMADTDAYQRAFDEMERLQAWDFEATIKQVLGKLGLQDTSVKTGTLSGGQKKRVALAKTLLSSPDLLILDEPTNHLDLDMIEWLEEYLSRQGLTLLMITHDRYFLENICDTILELEDAKLYQHPGNYSDFLQRKAERQEVEGVNVGKAKNLMRKELEWIRRQPKARGTKSKARIDAFHDLKKEAGKDLRQDELALDIKMERLGSKILELHRVRKSYGDKVILDGFDYTFKRGERIGIVGPNGVGKSTFLKLITGVEEPSGGKIITGETVKFGFYTQSGIQLADDKRVIDVIKDIAEYIPVGRKGRNITASQMLDRFLFSGDQQYSLVRKLSGGEKRRLYLCTILMENPNFLILDEPTNDLDILTLNVLEEFLLDFGGCLLIVTHDRYFMDKLTQHLFVFEGAGQLRDFNGNYTEYRIAKANEEATEKLREKSLVKAPAQKAKEAPKEEAPKKKLTYAERLELEALNEKLPQLEARKKEMAEAFTAAANDADRLLELSAESEKLQQELEEAEMRWLELSEFAE